MTDMEIVNVWDLERGLYYRWTLCKHVVVKNNYLVRNRPENYTEATEWWETVDEGDCPTCENAERRAAAVAAGVHDQRREDLDDKPFKCVLNERCEHLVFYEGLIPQRSPQHIGSLNLIAGENNPGWCSSCALKHGSRRQAPDLGPPDAAQEQALAVPGDILYSPPHVSHSQSPSGSEEKVHGDQDELMENVNTNGDPDLDNNLGGNQAVPEANKAPVVIKEADAEEAGVDQSVGEEGEMDEEEVEEEDDADAGAPPVAGPSAHNHPPINNNLPANGGALNNNNQPFNAPTAAYYTMGSGMIGIWNGSTFPIWGVDYTNNPAQRWYCQHPGCTRHYTRHRDMRVHAIKKSHTVPLQQADITACTAAMTRDTGLRALNNGLGGAI